jgi:hypothetical protein
MIPRVASTEVYEPRPLCARCGHGEKNHGQGMYVVRGRNNASHCRVATYAQALCKCAGFVPEES